MIDDFTGGFRTRFEARTEVDELLKKPLVSTDLTDAEQLAEYEEQMRESWGFSDEAIASQENWQDL